jgi:integrase/recombinase XerD
MARAASRLSRVLMTGPVAPFAEDFRRGLAERGYTPWTREHQLRQMARLSAWLEERGLAVAELSPRRVEEFLAVQRAGGRHKSELSRPGLRCLLDVLGGLGALAGADDAPREPSPTEVLLASFEHHLLAERGLASGTVRGYVRHAACFMDGLAPKAELASLTPRAVTEAVLRESSRLSVPAAQYFLAGLRAFLRFCFIEGLCAKDLSAAALSVSGRRRSSLPRGIAASDARALLHSCDRRTALGRRDHALLVTLLRLGLRASEVAGLRLDDIDWHAGELIVRGKASRADRLPLPADVGEAIAAYLRRGRPRSDRRELFLRARAPFGPIAPGTVASTVRRACRRVGINEVGPHRLRHTVACELVAAHVPLVDIAQILRHKSLQSTALYARVDLDQLRLLAAPWPGGAR